MLEGNAEEIAGKHFEIRKVCDRQINDAQRASIRDFCTVSGRGMWVGGWWAEVGGLALGFAPCGDCCPVWCVLAGAGHSCRWSLQTTGQTAP